MDVLGITYKMCIVSGDRIGRKGALYLGISICVPSVFLGGFAPTYIVYIALRFLTCTVIVFGWIAGHNFQIEFFSKSYRRASYCLNTILAHISGFSLPFLVFFNRNWTEMHIWCAIVSCLAFPLYFLIPESPRWLVANGKWQRAEIIFKVSRFESMHNNSINDTNQPNFKKVLKMCKLHERH